MVTAQIYKRIEDYIRLALNDSTISVYDANQNAPMDKKPFITVELTNFATLNMPSAFELDANGVRLLQFTKAVDIELQAYSDVLHEAETLLNDIQNSLRTVLADRFFDDELVYVKTLTGVSSIPTVVDVEMESRAVLAMRFHVIQEVYENIGLIDQMNIYNSNDELEIEIKLT